MLPVQFDENMISNSFLNKILSSTDMNNPSSPLYILYQTILNRCTLNMRGRLLPHLIYMYHFIHDRWSYLWTKDEAQDKNVGQLLTDYLSECSPDSKNVTMLRFDKLTGIWNGNHVRNSHLVFKIDLEQYSEYVKVSGAREFPTKVADLVTCGRNSGFLYETICSIVCTIYTCQCVMMISTAQIGGRL